MSIKATEKLHELGQSLWLDHVTRDLLDDGGLQTYIDDYSVTGLTSNPGVFGRAIASGTYDEAIRPLVKAGKVRDSVFFELALDDLRRAADLFAPIHDRTDGVDGWVSVEVSPLMTFDAQSTLQAAKELHQEAARDNLLIKIPGTTEGLPAIEEAIFEGVPVNVTLLYSPQHYLAAALAFLRGVERRIDAGLDPVVGSVASVSTTPWDTAVLDQVPDELRDTLALAVGLKTYQTYRVFLGSERWRRASAAGARAQRLLWASTSSKDPKAPDDLYLHCLGAPFTVNTVPEAALHAFFEHGHVGKPMPEDGGSAEGTFEAHAAAGVDLAGLATRLQEDAEMSFFEAWSDLMSVIDEQSASLRVRW